MKGNGDEHGGAAAVEGRSGQEVGMIYFTSEMSKNEKEDEEVENGQESAP